MHWHGRPRDHSAPRHPQVFASRQLDALGGVQKLFLDAVMIFLPAMVGERGDIVENEAVLLCVKLRRRFRVSRAPTNVSIAPASAADTYSSHRQRSRRLRTALPGDAVILELLTTRDKSLQGMSQRLPHTLLRFRPFCKLSYSRWRCRLTAANACTMNSYSRE